MKKFRWIAYIVLISIIIILCFSIYTSTAKDDKNIKEELTPKTLTEIKFLESKFVNLFNSINNIEFENYSISTSKMTEESSSQSTGSSSSDGGSGQSSGGGESSGNGRRRRKWR